MNKSDSIEIIGPDESTTGSSSLDPSTFDDVRQRVADKLHLAAETIQSKAAQNQPGTIANYASNAAEWLDDASGYIRRADTRQIKSDIKTQVRQNPGRSLLIAGAAGLLLGVLIRRS